LVVEIWDFRAAVWDFFMPMPPYPVLCYTPRCGAKALFKVAARWSDGTTAELKTYGLSCAACLAGQLARAGANRAACRLAPGETLEAPGVYELARGQRDRKLTRRPDLEAQLGAS
jgi:hypothetical protein